MADMAVLPSGEKFYFMDSCDDQLLMDDLNALAEFDQHIAIIKKLINEIRSLRKQINGKSSRRFDEACDRLIDKIAKEGP